MNTYIKTLLDSFGNQLFPRTRVDAVYLEDNTTELGDHLQTKQDAPTLDKTTPVDGDKALIYDSAASNVAKKLSWANIKATLKTYFDTHYNIGGATAKTTPVDADQIGIADSASSNTIKKVTFTNLKAFLKTYFDTLYPPKANPTLAGTVYTDYLMISGRRIEEVVTNGEADIAVNALGYNDTGTQFRDFNILNGKLEVIASFKGSTKTLDLVGGQIKFPATQVPSADPNTLDDYEEGTWTPTINTTTKTYTIQYGNYTKIGNLVTVSFNLVFSNTTSGTGDLQIGGLPFAVSNKNSNLRASGVISYNNLGSSIYSLYTQSGLGYLLIATGNAFLNRSAVAVVSIVIMGTITYETL